MLPSILRTARVAARPAVPASRGFARLTLIGRLAADPEVRQTKDGNDYVRYSVGTKGPLPPPGPDGTRPQREMYWHNIVSFFPGSYEYLSNLRKGAYVYVEATYEVKNLDATEEHPARRITSLRHEKIKVLDRGPNDTPREREGADA